MSNYDYGQGAIKDYQNAYPAQLQAAQQSPPLYSQGGEFTGPGRDYTPPSYVPQYGVTDWDSYARQWGLDQSVNAGMIQAGPQFALNQSTRDQLANQIALTQASQASQSGYLNQDYNTGLARIGLQGQQLDVQRGALGRQPQYLQNLHDLAQQLFGLNRTSATQQADINTRGLNSASTARGAFTSIGANEGRGDIQNQLANQLQGIDISSNEETTRYNESVSSLADQNKMLDLQGQSLGLDRQALKTELERGLDRLGLSTSLSISDLTQKLNSSNIEDQMLAQQIFNAAISSSDYYAQFAPPSANPSTPYSGSSGSSGSSTQVKQGAS